MFLSKRIEARPRNTLQNPTQFITFITSRAVFTAQHSSGKPKPIPKSDSSADRHPANIQQPTSNIRYHKISRMQIEKIYEPQRFEPHWARWWIDRGIFHASPKAGGRIFSLVIPPPNVTGSLHMRHILEHTEVDVVIRWHRVRGDNALWPPGTEQAGVAR